MKLSIALFVFVSSPLALATSTSDVLASITVISNNLNTFSAAINQGLSIPTSAVINDGNALTNALNQGGQVISAFTNPSSLSMADAQTIVNAIEPLVPAFQSMATAWNNNAQIYKTIQGLTLQMFSLADNMEIAFDSFGGGINDLIVPLGGEVAAQAFLFPVNAGSAIDSVSNTYFQLLETSGS
ncbi:hypothetical protein CPC08DRAFT_715966 [Agrocybe pediades]|nr:hypothetical protein CPC08DRAFT_717542 [Agrocybe pediades]KAF9546667.1 hypothetical protein CPC08DRAFT_715966 [Agrocybe pediades]